MFDILSLLEEPMNQMELSLTGALVGIAGRGFRHREGMLPPVPAALHKYYGVHVHAVLRLGQGGVAVGPGCMERYLCS